MSDNSEKVVDEQTAVDNVQQGELPIEHQEDKTENVQQNEENCMPSAQEQEEIIKKKYGGIIPKKKPLISKDHEHAFFDSADWALGKQGAQKPKGPLEALRPKLQPTPHHQVRSRRSSYASHDGEDAHDMGAEHHNASGENEKSDDVVVDDQSNRG